MDCSLINNDKGNKLFLKVFALYLGFSQIINILRITNIYNSIILVNYILLVLSLYFVVTFVLYFKVIRVKLTEVILFTIPLFYSIIGLMLNGFSRDILADTYNAMIFIIIFIYTENCNFSKYNKEFEFLVNVVFYSSILFRILTIICPLLGIKIISVAKIIYISILPLLYFYVTKKKLKMIVSLILVITGGKRSLIFAIIGLMVIQVFLSKQIKIKQKLVLLIFVILSLFCILFFSYSYSNIELLPDALHPMFVKIMKINPLSNNSDILSDFRVIEVISSIKPLLEDKILLVTGHGAGYTYDVLINGVITETNRHNVHFSPVSIYTKYGILYVLLYYGLVLNLITKGLHSKNLNYLQKIMLLYVILGLINSFFEFTVYTDYLYIISLGMLASGLNKKDKKGMEVIR